MKILDSEQMRNIDRRATERYGIPSLVLMENAAIAVADAILERYPNCGRAAIFCGTGNNGGDGLAVARHLENRGVVPVILILGDRAKFAGDALTNLTICERLNLAMFDVADESALDDALARAAATDLVVDAIFGTGLSRAPAGLYSRVITAIAGLRLPVVAVDLPSGANASSGEPFEPCLQADLTVTFAAPKLCHIFEPAALCCGEVIVADIAIPQIAIDDENVSLALTTPKDVQPLVMPRLAATHKGTYGHVGIVAGSTGKSGAAVLSARGAIRAGAGLVSVVSAPDVARLVNAGSIESMTFPIELIAPSTPAILDFLRDKDAALIGPGLADDKESYNFVRQFVRGFQLPLVVDASGLNAFAKRAADLRGESPRVITPHPGELARLLGCEIQTINDDRIGSARETARTSGCVVVLKGHHTLIADPDGQVNVNPTGNPGMASGGMGDVLGGIIAAFLARGIDAFDAATAGVYLHGLAGDILKDELGDIGFAAMDLAERIPLAIQAVNLD
ncbi:MAG TPA: NAD(P)H-hydrate dehydratase [Thermoanaerobaculia bacterium]|nr:NAD(P)H-hydrate dehydratase [Thermoanaerobaculia bacterium]